MKNIKDHTVNAFFATLFFVATAFFFSPLNVHYVNIAHFDFTASQVVIYLVVICLVMTFFVTKAVSFLGNKMVELVVVLLLALGILVWLQANIVPWDYGMLDGSEIDWDGKKLYGYLDSAMWILGIALTFWQRKRFYKNAKTIAVAFILIQGIFLAITIGGAPHEPSFKSYKVLEDQKYVFSAEQNVMVIVLDAFQSDVFNELISDNPNFKNVFDGFTYYRNALAGFPTTYPSIPLIMTGQFYENKITMQDFIQEVYMNDSLPKVLNENDYEVNLYPIKNTVFYDEKIADNFKKRSSMFINTREFLRFLTADIFKISPHFLKRFVHDGITKKQTEKSVSDQFFDFLEGIKTASVSAKSDDKVFKYYHLIGIHPPLLINENLETEQMEINRKNIKRQGIAMLTAMGIFIENLKKLEIYDKSMILIIADHGFGTEIDPSLYGNGVRDSKNVEARKRAFAIPLVLVKPLNSDGKLQISDAPVSLIDIPITIFKALGIDGNFVGKSMLEMKENESRTRKFLFFDWKHEYWKLEKRYLPPMEEYFVTGFSWLDSSWINKGNTLIPPTINQ